MSFCSWQWYRNGNPIADANEQFYYEPGGLNGDYQVQMTAADGTVYRSCVESFESVQQQTPKASSRKLLQDGQLLIIVDGKSYNMFGQQKGGNL